MRFIRAAIAAIVLAFAMPAIADPLPNGAPGANSSLAACIEGRAVRFIGGQLSCAPATATPTLANCGTSPSISPNATDYSGVVYVGSGVVMACTVVFTVTHDNPQLGCLSQSTGLALLGPTTTNTGLTQAFTASSGGATFSYVCFPK